MIKLIIHYLRIPIRSVAYGFDVSSYHAALFERNDISRMSFDEPMRLTARHDMATHRNHLIGVPIYTSTQVHKTVKTNITNDEIVEKKKRT